MDNIQGKNKIFTYLLVVFFAIFIGTGIFLLIANKKTFSPNEQAASTSIIKEEKMIIPTAAPTRGFINLQLDNNLNIDNFVKGDLINLELLGDSDGENITGFDVLINYDPLTFDFIKAESKLSAFKVYSFIKNNRLTLTVVKTSQDKALTVFKGSSIVSLVFKSKKSGNFTFAILSSFGKETTKFVNDKTEVIYSATNEIKVTIN
ncbi:MAG: hypothetical protein Q7U68_07975 [Candidatus Roizmanbacteria bacterium]|nr:hypothetical protein [Candidatus Roizmanbacteria bacterium]